MSAKIHGLRRVRKTLQRYPKQAKAALQGEIRAAGNKVRDKAKEEAPVDTTNLRNSIRLDVSNIDDLYAEVLTTEEYARRQELGFTGTDSLGRSYDQEGHFYMTKAAAQERTRFVREVSRSMKAIRLRGSVSSGQFSISG